jgi:hypothetical protein
MPFKGETLQCAICEKTKMSSRQRWVYLRLNDIGFYVCSECLCNHETMQTRPIPASTLNMVSHVLGVLRQ